MNAVELATIGRANRGDEEAACHMIHKAFVETGLWCTGGLPLVVREYPHVNLP